MEVQVGAKLQTAVGVGDGQASLDVVGHSLGCGVGQVVQGQDDDVVAHADAAVFTAIAQEGCVFGDHRHDGVLGKLGMKLVAAGAVITNAWS